MKRLQQDKHLEMTTQGMHASHYPMSMSLFGGMRPGSFPGAGGYGNPYGVNPYSAYPSAAYGAAATAAASYASSAASAVAGASATSTNRSSPTSSYPLAIGNSPYPNYASSTGAYAAAATSTTLPSSTSSTTPTTTPTAVTTSSASTLNPVESSSLQTGLLWSREIMWSPVCVCVKSSYVKFIIISPESDLSFVGNQKITHCPEKTIRQILNQTHYFVLWLKMWVSTQSTNSTFK